MYPAWLKSLTSRLSQILPTWKVKVAAPGSGRRLGDTNMRIASQRIASQRIASHLVKWRVVVRLPVAWQSKRKIAWMRPRIYRKGHLNF